MAPSIERQITDLLKDWKCKISSMSSYNPTQTLEKLCDIVETELEKEFTRCPNEFHYKIMFQMCSSPNLGLISSTLSSDKIEFMKKLKNDYLQDDLINIAACKLLVNLLLGCSSNTIFHNPPNNLIEKLFSWAEKNDETLQTDALGLLASFMENKISANDFKTYNHKLIPIILNCLHDCTLFCGENENNQNVKTFSTINNHVVKIDNISKIISPRKLSMILLMTANDSNNWMEMYQFSHLSSKLVMALKYLTTITKYQEFVCYSHENNAVNLVIKLINSPEKLNDYLTFEALKYLAVLLCDSKMAIKLIASKGLQKLLLIPKHSIASTCVLNCFYNLSTIKVAMENISQLSNDTLVDIVKFELWILEHSYDKSTVAKIFKHSFNFRVIQEIFDNHDGLRKLINVVSMSPLLTSENNNSPTELTLKFQLQIIHDAIDSLKHYFESHLHIKVQQIHEAKIIDTGLMNSSIPNNQSYKKCEAEILEEIQLLSNVMSMNNHWTPVDKFIELDGLNLLLQIMSSKDKWNFFGDLKDLTYGIIKNSLDIINICAVLPKVRFLLCEPLPSIHSDHDLFIVTDDLLVGNIGLNIIIGAARGDFINAEIQKASLYIIITCVCAPIHREERSEANHEALHTTNNDVIIERTWDCFRIRNGLMDLLKLIKNELPIKDADAIRGLASRALAGLARSESVRQIISQLPLFNNNQLQNLMKNPILIGKHKDHAMFRKYAFELLELVFGKTKNNGAEIETSLVNMNQAHIVAQTKININHEQLLLLIHQHLTEHGLSETADILVKETNLNITEKKTLPFTYVPQCQNQLVEGRGWKPSVISNCTLQKSESSNGFSSSSSNLRRMNSSPIDLNVKRRRSEMHPKPEPKPKSKLDHIKIDQDTQLQPDSNNFSTVTLESIVKEKFNNQHASCKNPIATCPTFDLFVPHKCPDPKPKRLCENFAVRFSKNIHSRRQDQRLIFSKFRPTIKFSIDAQNFTFSEYLKQNRIAIGTSLGDIIVLNTFTSQEEQKFKASNSSITHLECSNDENLLISSSYWKKKPRSWIWNISDELNSIKYSLEEMYCTFSNQHQTKLLGSNEEVATIYDVETCKKLMILNPKISNRYKINRAAFDATNEIVLSDGVLWDANTGKEIYKFDKLNLNTNGIFHPNGLEIISNTEVWDMRTFKLLRTVSSLDQCEVMFSKTGKGMFSYCTDQMSQTDKIFKTYDPYDYSNIATINVNRYINHMACDKYDTQIANVESVYNSSKSFLQIYDIGIPNNINEMINEEDDVNFPTVNDMNILLRYRNEMNFFEYTSDDSSEDVARFRALYDDSDIRSPALEFPEDYNIYRF